MSPLTYIFGLPLLTALVIVLIPRSYKVVIRALAILGSFIAMIGAICVFVNFNSAPVIDGFRYVQKVPWVESLGISYHVGVDGINLGLILMGAIVSFAAVCISNHIKNREKEFYILLLVMSGGILGAFASLDMFFLYFLHELALVPTFIMIGVWGRGENKNYATFQITLYLSLGALLLLIGLIALYLQMPLDVRTFDIVEMTRYFKANSIASNAQHLIFPLLLFGFGILVSLWPFHSWAPLGYASAPPATAMIHAGVLKKFGLYGLIRIALPMMSQEAQNWMTLLAWLCLGNIIYNGLVAIRQRDLNMLIGNSSVAHMGFAFLGIASLSLVGVTGTVLIMVAHGLLAALTFALSGYIANQINSTKIADMGGLLRAMPYIGAVMIMAMLAGCGLPGFASFPGEALVLFGSWSQFTLVTGIAIWGALVIAGVYMLRAIRNMPYALLLAGLIIFGCFPRLLTDNIKKALPDLLPSETMVAQIQK
jgi:NADH-quinone oxidoreductase subunit M